MSFPVNAREGVPYKTPKGKLVTISDTIKNISVPETQADALCDLGITLEDRILKIEFYETGNPYIDPQGDRTKVGEETTEKITTELQLKKVPPKTLNLKAFLEPFTEQSVNFAGQIYLTTPDGENRRIPMTGRGTAALEGKANDFHAGFCTGGTCATFQERTALVLAVAAAAGATNEQLESIGEKLRSLNDQFHGRGDILTYTIKASQTPQNQIESYTEFMKSLYPEGKRSPFLKNVINTGKPDDAYYQKALIKMTTEEIEEDKKAL